jgi:hypothetical protein
MSLRQYFNIRVADSGVSGRLRTAYGHAGNLAAMNEAMTYLSIQAACARQGLTLAALDERDLSLHALDIQAPGENAQEIAVAFTVNPQVLQKLMEQTGHTGITEMLEDAIALYDAVHRAKSQGRSIVKANPETGQFRRVAIYTPVIKPAGRDYI